MELTAGNKESWLLTIWKNLPVPEDEARWDDICTAMAWIAEEIGVDQDILFELSNLDEAQFE